MALILIRAESQAKILNSLADIERHAKLKITGKPRIMDSGIADEFAQEIIKDKLRSKSKNAVLVSVKEDTTHSILQIRNIHPPAHLMVISKEYPQWGELKKIYSNLPSLKGYYSAKK
ncbi:MAG: DUF356 domain-containing protein [Euryarchaeota archaeon]|jgi:hypothetical protein|uniref:DUF356 domain-containing protein n=1 Tax=Methanobacterium sp. MZD130B TaxID=3394378 RepID=UPI0017759AF6|nr:DUF356 domain-containing protein [Euryarchaeota archaeon]HHT19600.1 DUF356 domain-containing protein [Methanobacterium sp.]